MHLATPAHSSFRGYVAGGARATIPEVDDSSLMQSTKGNFMKGEQREKIEAPQNYGFSSVVMDADKGQDGQISNSAEGFITFCGGNRSFPVCTVMDDRRHRLKGLEKGDVAMFRTKDDAQQFHMTKDGGFWSAPNDKTVRMQLVEKQQDQQQSGGKEVGATDASGGGASGDGAGGQQQEQKPTGQKPVYKDGKDKSTYYVDVTKDKTTASGNEVHLKLTDKTTYLHIKDQKAYVGGELGKHKFARIITEAGPSINSFARIGGGADDEVLVVEGRSGEPNLPKAIAALALALVLGASLGMNYRLLADAWAAPPLAFSCGALAAR